MTESSPAKALFVIRKQRSVKSPPVVVFLDDDPSPQQPPKLSSDLVLKIVSEFVPLEDIFSQSLYLISKKFRWKLVKFALIHQPAFMEDMAHRRWVWLTFCARARGSENNIFSDFLAFERSPELVSEIERDIVRTMPSHPLFSLSNESVGSSNREKLRSVLLAISSAEPSVGYCQGMNFVAAILLLNLNMSPEDAFRMFRSIIRDYHFKYLYSPAVPLLPLRMFTFSRLVRQHVPQVWHHLNSKTFSVEIFANQWIMTLFAYYLDCSILGPHIWTLFFLQGWKVIYQIGLAILSLLEKEICAMDVEEISSFMASSRSANSVHPFSNRDRLTADLVLAVSKFRIKNSDLDMLSQQFLSEKLMTVLNSELVDDDDASSLKSSIDNLEEISSRSLGFVWLATRENRQKFLRVDLSAFSTPNRPFQPQVYKDAYRQVDVPVSSLRQIQRTLALVADKTNKEIGVTTNQLQEIERKLLVETKQFNALVFNASRVDDVFKEVANRKQGLAEKLSEAVIGGRGEEVRNLMKKMSEIEVEYDGKKLERNDMYAILSQLEDKIARISADKTKCIVRISSLTAELEATQNEVISRSIQSAIDSFSAS